MSPFASIGTENNRRRDSLLSSHLDQHSEFWLAPPVLLSQSTALQKIRPETLRSLHLQNRQSYWYFVTANLFWVWKWERFSPCCFPSLPRRDDGKAGISERTRQNAFAAFRQADLPIIPLIICQVALSVLFVAAIYAALTEIVQNIWSIATVAVMAIACAFGWMMVGLHVYYVLRARRAHRGVERTWLAMGDGQAVDSEAVVREEGGEHKEHEESEESEESEDGEEIEMQYLTEEDVVSETLLFRTKRVIPEWVFDLEIVWTCLVTSSLYLFLLTFSLYVDQNVELVNTLSAERHRISDAFLVLLLILPTLAYLVLKSVSFQWVALHWVVSVLFSVILLITFDFYKSWSSFAVFLIFSLVLLITVHRKDWVSFVLATDLRLALVENALKSEEIKSNELKHMLGNIAHDLKTPMSSVVSGLELLSSLALELHEQLRSEDEAGIAHLLSKVRSISQLASSLEHTNSLITMTINRCLDYHRTRHGMQLVPHIEAISVESAVLTPVRCLQGMGAAAVEMQIEFDPQELAVETMWTDKLWLHDNLLCLVGNAIKFSQRQPVKIVVSMVQSLPQRVLSTLSRNGVETTEREPERTERVARTLSLAHISNISSFIPTMRLQAMELDETSSQSTPPQYRESAPSLRARGIDTAIVLFEVFDLGPGVPASHRDPAKLFGEPSQASRSMGGSGLGLFSLAQRVRTLGGQFGMYSRVDTVRGSCFWFSIPMMSLSTYCTIRETAEQDEEAKQEENQDRSVHDVESQDVSKENEAPREAAVHGANNVNVNGDGHVERVGLTLARPSPEQPAALAAPPSRVQRVPSHSPVHSLAPKSGSAKASMTVLVVDDSAVITRMVAMLLKRHGHSVCTAENGLVAVQIIQHQLQEQSALRLEGLKEESKSEGEPPLPLAEVGTPIDVILMDFQMPVMSGVEAVRRIRAMEKSISEKLASSPSKVEELRLRHKIIGFSAKSDPNEIREAMDAGIDAFMAKPFTVDAFYQILHSIG